MALLAPVRIESAPLRRRIVAAVQEAIEAGVLRPGARVVERTLCEQLGVSRTSMREALRELEASGAVVRVDGRLTVPDPDGDGLAAAYQVRLRLETLVVERLIACASDEELRDVADRGNALATAYEAGSPEGIRATHGEFYRRLLAGARSPLAAEYLRGAMLRTSGQRARAAALPRHRLHSAAHVRTLAIAIAGRDVRSATLALERHIDVLAAAVPADARVAEGPEGRAGA